MVRIAAWIVVPVAVAGLPLVGAVAATSALAAAPCTKTYESVVNADIPIGAGDNSVAIDVLETDPVADVDYMVDISHPNDGDVSIVAHRADDEGIRVLADGVGGDGDDFDHTVFDDEAETSITDGSAPFAGRFSPMDPIDVWDGDSAGGSWYISVKESSGHVGDVFTSWALILTFQSCDLDGDGVEDHVDKCVGAAGETRSGCPLVDRELTLRYKSATKKFQGRLESSLAGCRSGRDVEVWRVRKGPDAKVGTTKTRRDGRWALGRKAKRGQYYATSARVVVPTKGECSRTTSPRSRVR